MTERVVLSWLSVAGKPAALSISDRCDGKPCKAGYTCHVVNDGAEIVMFDMAAILPTFVVHYQ